MMNRLFVIGAVIIVIIIAMTAARYIAFNVLSGKTPDAQGQLGYRQVSPQEAKALMDSETDFVILDVRTPLSYDKLHIPGAENLTLNDDFGKNAAEMLPDRGQLILVYCNRGNWSKTASRKLAEMGYTNVVEFGGILDWPYETVGSEKV